MADIPHAQGYRHRNFTGHAADDWPNNGASEPEADPSENPGNAVLPWWLAAGLVLLALLLSE